MSAFTKIFFISLALALVLLPVFVFGVEGEEEVQGLVPCGNKGQLDCTLCDLFVLINKIKDFATFIIAIPLAVGFMAYGGIRMAAAGGGTEGLEKGKKAITSALIGIFLVFGAWLIIDLILGNLLKEGGVYWPWNKFPQCEQAKGADTGSSLSSGVISGAALTARGESSLRINVRSLKSSCNPSIAGFVNAANLNGIKPERVKAIIMAESWGDPTATTRNSDGTYSCGLMQVTPSTAKQYDSTVWHLSPAQICDKLISDANFNINIGTKYYSAMLKKYGDPVLAHAAYNGGPSANNSSVNCPGIKRWQCEWDNDAHTVPNTGYAPTRKYIDNINKYYSNPSC